MLKIISIAGWTHCDTSWDWVAASRWDDPRAQAGMLIVRNLYNLIGDGVFGSEGCWMAGM